MTTHRSAFWAAISLIIAVLALMALDRGTAQAKIYKYKDDQGKTHFTDDRSKIPLKYRTGPQTKEFRGLSGASSPSPSPSPSATSSSGTSAGDTKGASAGAAAKAEGFTEDDAKLAKDSIAMFKKGVTLAKQYEGLSNNSRVGKELYNALQASIPAKETLVKKLGESKAPALAPALSLMQKTLAGDKATPRIKPQMVREIRALIDRIVAEGPPQASMITKLEQAIKKAEKDKAEAEQKKAQEKKAERSEKEK